MIDRVLDPIVRRLLSPPRRTPRMLPPDLRRLAADVTIEAESVPLKAWLLRGSSSIRGVVVIIHGWGSDGARSAGLARGLLDAGIAALLVDLPGHGRTPRAAAYDLPCMLRDIAAARRWIEGSEALRGAPVGLLGISFGGVGAYASARRDRSWSALALVGVPVGPQEASRIYLNGKGLPGAWLTALLGRSVARVLSHGSGEFRGEECLPMVEVPVLIVHGVEDRVVPLAHAQALAAATRERWREVHWVSGAGHVLADEPSAQDRIARFFRMTLAGG